MSKLTLIGILILTSCQKNYTDVPPLYRKYRVENTMNSTTQEEILPDQLIKSMDTTMAVLATVHNQLISLDDKIEWRSISLDSMKKTINLSEILISDTRYRINNEDYAIYKFRIDTRGRFSDQIQYEKQFCNELTELCNSYKILMTRLQWSRNWKKTLEWHIWDMQQRERNSSSKASGQVWG